MGKTAVSIDDDVLEAGRRCAASSGMSFSAWLTDAARVKARRENAETYGRWLAGQSDTERSESALLSQLGDGVRAGALTGAEW